MYKKLSIIGVLMMFAFSIACAQDDDGPNLTLKAMSSTVTNMIKIVEDMLKILEDHEKEVPTSNPATPVPRVRSIRLWCMRQRIINGVYNIAVV